MGIRIYGHRSLKTLSGLETRPTAARVREAVFHVWRDRVEGCRWLDLCAGIGSMGAEALGRGALSVTGIERSGRACTIIRQNWQTIARNEQTFQILRGDVLARLKQLRAPFDCIYFDPPYRSGLYDPVLAAIRDRQLLTEGELAAEFDPNCWHGSPPEGWDLCRQKTYGKTTVGFYRVAQ